MLIVNDTPVMASVSQIVTTLQRELHIAGIELLRDVQQPKFKGQDMMVTCPFHKHGQENKPSCGITTRQKRRGLKIVEAGTVHCFVCHTTRTLDEFVGYCFDQDKEFGANWILDHFSNFDIEKREGFFRLPSREHKEEKLIEYITEEELSKYRYFHPYMYKRYLTDEQIDYFD